MPVAAKNTGRLIALQRWTKHHLGESRHERRVLGIAAALFDLTADVHQLSSTDRRLLKFAVMVHDVGRCNGADRHHQHGERLLRKDLTLPLSEQERRQLRYLTRHHRGPVPEVGADQILQPGDGRKRLRLILGLLRAADTLDNRRRRTAALAIRRRGKSVMVVCHVEKDSAGARRALARRKKFRLLEETLGLRMNVDVLESTATALDARA